MAHQAQRRAFDAFLQRLKDRGFLKGRAVQRTDSLAILTTVRELTQLELVMETLRLALEAIVGEDSSWLQAHVPGEWLRLYGLTRSGRIELKTPPLREAPLLEELPPAILRGPKPFYDAMVDRLTHGGVVELLGRPGAAEVQAGLGKTARRRNVAGAFAVRRRADVRGKHVLLIDDVMTTGSTATACGLALKRAGATSVSLLTLARVDRRWRT